MVHAPDARREHGDDAPEEHLAGDGDRRMAPFDVADHEAVEAPADGSGEREQDDERVVVEDEDAVEDNEGYTDDGDHRTREEPVREVFVAMDDAVDEGGDDGRGADDEGDGRGGRSELDGSVLGQEVERTAREAEDDEEQLVA